jgi:hypothetical protein
MKEIEWTPARIQETGQDAPSWQARLNAQAFCRLERDAALTADAHGCITDYSLAAAHLLGRGTENLAGQALTQVIAQLPFGADTPGYNLAYTVFHGADGRWQRHTTLTPDGRVIPVDVALASVMMNGNRAIKLTLKAADSGQQAHCH